MIELKKCPFCGTIPELISDDLGAYHDGYPGCVEYKVVCNNDECLVKPQTRGYNTIYEKSIMTQMNKAIEAWNNRNRKE